MRLSIFAVAVLALASAGFAAWAQERAPVQMQMQANPAQIQLTTPDGKLTPQLQTRIETGEPSELGLLLPAVQGVRAGTPAASTPRSPATSFAPNPGGGSEYICNSGACACAGATDCVNMVAGGHCVEGTVGCNDYGCTCQGAD